MREVTIHMKHRRAVSKSAHGDQTIDTRANGDRCPSRVTIKLHCIIENAAGPGILEDRDVSECGDGDLKCPLIVNALKHFLHDGQARHDRLARYGIAVTLARAAAKHLNPCARVDQNHLALYSGSSDS